MKYIIICFVFFMVSSCTSQKNVPGQTGNSDSLDASTGSNETKAATPTKSIILNNTESGGTDETKAATPTKSIILNNSGSDKNKKPTGDKGNNDIARLPACVQKLVKAFLEEDVQNPPRKIYSYTYNGNLVYYVTPPCCDFFSDLYDAQCKLIAHPDGGITGRGDGRAKDFAEKRSNEKLVWEDVRRR